VALFAGAGVSTESQTVLRQSLVDMVAGKLGRDPSGIAFPDLMEELACQPNGRFELIKLIKERFDYIHSHPELHDMATRFHDELATIFQINTIVTTNWDTNFEDRCGATPFVHPEDVAFWEVAERKVLKIHGTIQNYGSIIATRSDYKRAEEKLNKNMIGSLLKLLLATKTVVYFGYSLRDDDFLSLLSLVRDEMKELGRISYIVTLDGDEESLARYKALGLTPIVTDGTHFLSQLKARLVSDSQLHPDTVYEAVADLLVEVQEAHVQLYDELDMFDHPVIILCASYQDGMMHGLKRILRRRSSGEYSHPCRARGSAAAYTAWRAEKLRAKRYDDVAYIDGYMNALLYLDAAASGEVECTPPLFHALGSNQDIYTFEDYRQLLPEIPGLHKAACRYAKEAVERCAPFRDQGIVMHHQCAL
jgi:hypothetical protein